MVMAVSLATSLLFGIDFAGTENAVQAAESMPSDSTQITTDIIPDIQLCYAMRYIIGGDKYADITINDVRTYTGKIDLSVYSDYDKIESLEGLGYARNASSIDASKLAKVKQIKDNEFQNCLFTTFGMPSNVVEIGKGAFFNCTNLTYTNLPSTLTTIQSEAFRNCKSLDGISIPDGIVKIGNNAFAVCESLSSIVIPDGINATIGNAGDDSAIGLGGGIFDGCISLESVKIGAGMTAIPAAFLAHTYSLRNIEIPERINNIMDGAFSGSGILSIDLSANTGITSIATSVFDGCTALCNVKLPDSIETIEDGAFNSCMCLTDFSFVTRLSGLKKIGTGAFQNCGFTTVTIPHSVEKIDAYAFAHSAHLKTVVIEDFEKVEGNIIKKIGEYAFDSSYFLESVILPTANENNPQVTIEIGKYAFNKCRHLTDINFPANVTKIDDYAFNECGYSTTDWKYDDDEFAGKNRAKVKYVMQENIHTTRQPGDEEFVIFTTADSRYYQPGTAYINPDSMKSSKADLGDAAITIYVQLDLNDPNFYKGSKLHYQYIVGLESVDLSACSQLALGEYAFYKCVNLENVVLPDELKSIPKYAFAECSAPILMGNGSVVSSNNDVNSIYADWYYGLQSVKMGNKIESIGDNAFYKDYNLVINGELPSSLKKIGNYAYRYCESLTAVTLPRNIEYIGQYAFANTSRIVKEYMSEKKLLDFNASYAVNLQYIGSKAFDRSGIKSFIMDKNAPLTKLDTYTFYDCQYLDTVVLSKSVANICNYALGACLRLKSVNVYDCCTFESGSIKGGILATNFPNEQNTQHGYWADDKFYMSTYEFNLAITPLNDYVTVRQNEVTNLPLYTIDADSYGYYSQVKIADNTYIYDTKTGILEGEQNPDRTNMIPEMTSKTNQVLPNDYIKGYNTEAYVVALEGLTEGKNIAVNVQEYLVLMVSDDTRQVYSPTITYAVDVTGVPCVGIDIEDKQYVSVSATQPLTISPNFISETGGAITDEVEWKILTGSDYITMSVAENGKSISVMPKGSACGSASIQIKAGQITKTIYVNTVAPASSIIIEPARIVDMMYGEQIEITAITKYSSEYSDLAEIYPDAVRFKSSNENVVKVIKTVDAGGKTVCTLSAKGAGSATITAVAAAGRKSSSITVYVSSDNLKLTLADGNGEKVASGDSSEIRTRTGVTYTYDFNELLGNEEVIVESSDESVVKATVSTRLKTITFNAYKVGKAQITVYPTVGTKENGVTFTMYVNGDVSYIILANRKIPAGCSDSVFTYMTNIFRQKITEANAASFASITDNTIEFTSSDTEYASVDKYGRVTVHKYSGDVKPVTIICTAYNKKGEAVKSVSTTVTPQKPSVKDINITGNTSVNVGNTVSYKLAVVPAEGDYTKITVSYVSGTYKIASYQLSSDYKTLTVKGVAPGAVTLKIKVQKYSTVVVSKQLKIIVNKTVLKAPSKVKWSKCKGSKKKVSLKWKRVSNAAGYQIQMSSKKNGKFKKVKTIASGKVTKCTIKKLKKRKNYYFRIRAFIKGSNGKTKYGKWSVKKRVKTK